MSLIYKTLLLISEYQDSLKGTLVYDKLAKPVIRVVQLNFDKFEYIIQQNHKLEDISMF